MGTSSTSTGWTARRGAPLVLVLHGLEGSAQSHYVVGLLRLARARGWRGVVMHFRSCSGELNRRPRFYHSGETDDLAAVVDLLVARDPAIRLGAVGTSLGGNVLLKWLGEWRDDVPAQVRAAVGVSVPFDLAACVRRLDRGFHRAVYAAHFLRTMRRKVQEKARSYPGFVDVEAARRARTFAQYDRVVTAPLNGFTDEQDYWRRASCSQYLDRIRRPTLLIGALDDPIVPAEVAPGSPAAAAAPARGVPARRRTCRLPGTPVGADLLGRAPGAGFPRHRRRGRPNLVA